jgi:hypothetical protein
LALSTSNTFHTAAASDSISAARGYWNSSFKALLENFASANAIPAIPNINFEGGTVAPPQGMLYFNATTGAMYVNTDKYGSGPYGSFRRLGIGTRSYTDLAAAVTDNAALDPGELIVVINDTGGSPANNRLYLVSDTNKTLVDVSRQADRSISNVSLKAQSITGFEIASGTINNTHIADGTIITADVADNSITDQKLNSTLVLLGMVL